METQKLYGQLVLLEEGGREVLYDIKSSDIVIGREAKCEIVVESKSISRRHAKVFIGKNAHSLKLRRYSNY